MTDNTEQLSVWSLQTLHGTWRLNLLETSRTTLNLHMGGCSASSITSYRREESRTAFATVLWGVRSPWRQARKCTKAKYPAFISCTWRHSQSLRCWMCIHWWCTKEEDTGNVPRAGKNLVTESSLRRTQEYTKWESHLRAVCVWRRFRSSLSWVGTWRQSTKGKGSGSARRAEKNLAVNTISRGTWQCTRGRSHLHVKYVRRRLRENLTWFCTSRQFMLVKESGSVQHVVQGLHSRLTCRCTRDCTRGTSLISVKRVLGHSHANVPLFCTWRRVMLINSTCGRVCMQVWSADIHKSSRWVRAFLVSTVSKHFPYVMGSAWISRHLPKNGHKSVKLTF